MQTALQETVLLGVTTNWQFLQDVLADPDFHSGQAHTNWVEQRFAGWQPPNCPFPPDVLIGAALSQLLGIANGGGASLPAGTDAIPAGKDPYTPWRSANGFRSGE
jgi:hypothetical protein